MGVVGPVGILRRNLLPGRQVDHVDRAGGDDLRDAHTTGILQAVAASGDDRAMNVVGDFLQAEVEHGGELVLRGERLCPAGVICL